MELKDAFGAELKNASPVQLEVVFSMHQEFLLPETFLHYLTGVIMD